MNNKINENIQGIYSLTALQEGMLFHKILDADSSSYFEQNIVRFKGSFHVRAAVSAMNLVSYKHEALRTSFIYEDVAQPQQVILKRRNPEVCTYNISQESEKEKRLNKIREDDMKRGFNLAKDPLFRTTWIKYSDDEFLLMLSFHHIIMDGWCTSIVLGDFLKFYQELTAGKPFDELEKEIEGEQSIDCGFGEYIKWLEKQDHEAGLRYWEELLSDCIDISEIRPLMEAEPEEASYSNEIAAELDVEITEKVNQLCKLCNVTVNTIVESAIGILLQKINRSDTVVYGKIVSGRDVDLPGIEDMVGLFINSIPVKVQTDENKTVKQLVKEMFAQAMESSMYEHCALADIQSKSKLGTDLIKVLVVFENYYVHENIGQKDEDLEIELVSTHEETNYDLVFYAYQSNVVGLKIAYNTKKFRKTEIEQLLNMLSNIITDMVKHPDKKVSDINEVSRKDIAVITEEFNPETRNCKENITIIERFEKVAGLYPNKLAVVSDQTSLTYAQLNGKANTLARKLRSYGVKPNDKIVLMTERCAEMVVAIYGIIKAGGAYIPVDPTYPQSRVQYIIEDCDPKVVLIHGAAIETDKPVIEIDDLLSWKEVNENPERVNQIDDLMYLIYTSGTSGRPKGVMVREEGVVNLFNWMKEEYRYCETDVMLQKTTFTFDVSVSEIFFLCFTGGTLALLEKGGEKEPETICRAIEKYNVSIVNFVPSMLNVFLQFLYEQDKGKHKLQCLRYVMSAGEALNTSVASLFYKIADGNQHFGAELINLYGPTEATVYATYYNACKNLRQSIPIGKPIPNTSIYILSGTKICGIGIPGELCITGIGLAEGYLNRPELNEEKFVKNPFGEGKMYRTGDLAYWQPDGEIAYLGRMDDQVKIRGFRIELGEIESLIRDYEGITNVAVAALAVDKNEKSICAYFVSEQMIEVEALKAYLAEKIPNYMIPSYFLQIDQIPVTGNGKLDRRSLPQIQAVSSRQYVAPRTKAEKELCLIFCKVLGAENIGIHDDFFELGGHSLKATRLVNHINAKFSKKVSLKEIFSNPTVEKLARLITGKVAETYYNIRKAEQKEYYAMSPAQKRMYLLAQIDEEGLVYNMPQIVKLDGSINVDTMRHAFETLIRRHEILRTEFILHDGQPVQRIKENVTADFVYAEDEKTKEQELFTEFVRPFYLDHAPLVRMKLVKRADHYLLMMDMHHIIGDGVSFEIFIRELSALYNGKELGELLYQYKDYSEWFQTQNLSKAKQYWLNEFSDEVPVLDIVTDYKRPLHQSFRGQNVYAMIGSELLQKINQLCVQTDTTRFMVYLGAAMVLLEKYSRQEDIVIGSPVSGRTDKNTENMIGMFVNTLALRGRPRADLSFEEFLSEIRETCLNAYEYQSYPFEALVDEVVEQRDISRNPLFDVMLALQNSSQSDLDLQGARNESVAVENTVARVDLSFNIIESEDDAGIMLEYCSDLFTKGTAQRILKCYVHILTQIVDNSKNIIGNITTVDRADSEMLLHQFNKTFFEYPRELTMVDLFEQQVSRSPQNVALMFENEQMTYQELNAKANALACRLRESGVGPNDFVVLFTERSFEMLIGIYGIIKAGGAYIPVDPAYPKDRIDYILADAKPKAILAGKKIHAGAIPVFSLKDMASWDVVEENPVRVNQPDDFIYMIYTSGTTGRPKGVMNKHRGIVNLLWWMQQQYVFDENDVILQKTTYTFDVSVSEMFLWCLFGGRLAILKQGGEKEPAEICRAVKQNKVTVIDFAPSMLNVFLTYIDNRPEAITSIRSLRYIFSAGEALNIKLAQKFYEIMKEENTTQLVNLYGPTEASIYASYYNCYKEQSLVPIGKPIGNSQLYILDGVKLCGIGIPGELCIAGDGVAAGYLNREDLTNEKFIDVSFVEGKLYRTGDLARWLPDGMVDYLGRMDDQVKIRGFRIELGEIESVIREFPGVDNVVVLAKKDNTGDNSICVYFSGTDSVQTEQIRSGLYEKLPDYMVPAYIMKLESIPTNRNGKVDRKALPAIEVLSTEQYVAPRNEMEEKLTSIFKQVLRVEQVGIYDNFFHLGGHSLKAVSVINFIEEEYGIRIPLAKLFEKPTVAQLAKEFSDRQFGVKDSVIPQAKKSKYYLMSPAQKRVYLINEIDDTGVAYNMPGNFEMKGCLDIKQLEKAFVKLIQCQEVLRTSFQIVDGQMYQMIAENVEFELGVATAVQEEVTNLYHAFIQPFDLQKAPLMRAQIVTVSEEKHYLFLDLHHIISDGASMNILINELFQLYNGVELKKHKIQYKDYSEWLYTKDLEAQRKYWVDLYKNDIPVLDLPLDYIRPLMQSFHGRTMNMAVESSLKEKIGKLSKETGVTEFMIFLSAMMILMSKYSRQEDIVIGTPVTGRTNRSIENVVGMFVNTLALRGQPKREKEYLEFLKEVKKNCLAAYENQEFPFEELVDEVVVTREMSRNPIFDVMFSMNSVSDSENVPLNGLEISSSIDSEFVSSKFDLSVDVAAVEDAYYVNMEYCTDLFKEETIKTMMYQFVSLLEDIAANPKKKICELTIVSSKEQKVLLKQYNNTDKVYPDNQTIVELFEEQCQKYENKVALKFLGTTMTYGKLNEEANKVAHHLRELGTGRNDFVAILPERSIEMIVAILGVLKAGSVYVPIDPTYPLNRIQYMLEDCKAKAIITVNAEKPKGIMIPEIHLETGVSITGEATNPEGVNAKTDAAYVIYTSGTTGTPKGVVVEHHNLVNLIYAYKEIYELTEDDTILQFASISFDQSVWDIFNSLLIGGSLCLMPYNLIGDVRGLENYMEENAVTVAALTPAFLREINPERLHHLRVIESGGASAEINVLRAWLQKGKTVFNTYGPTETTVNAISYRFADAQLQRLPIGKPIPNVQIYILDGTRLCGVGVPGELCIAGAGVARGYLNKKELTNEKFVVNPFGKGKMYRSGDLARWLPDGSIDYMGRIDEQIKIRGYRIELGEVENVLKKQTGVVDAAVVAKMDLYGDNCICAYIVADREMNLGELKKGMKKDIPEYMVPAYMMQIETIPVTKNGKVDKRALPEIELQQTKEYVAPETEMEAMVAGIFEEVLGIGQVGRNDSFFELGGHSLRATKVINAIDQRLGVKISMREIFTHDTPELLAQLIEGDSQQQYKTIPKAEKKVYYAMSSVQKRMYLLSELDSRSISYNMPGNLLLTGDVSIERIRRSFGNLVMRHQALRTSFTVIDDEMVQVVHDNVNLELPYIKIDEDKVEEAMQAFIQPFDLSEAPLMRMQVVQIAEDKAFLFIDMHHIISDGISCDIIMNDFMAFYNGEKLEELKIQYVDYCEWFRKRDYSEQKKYWLDVFSEEVPMLNLPLDFNRPALQSYRGNTKTFILKKDMKDQIKNLTTMTRTTEFMFFLSAVSILLSQYSGQEDIVIGTTVSGRNYKDIENVVGMFVNTLAMRERPEKTKKYMEFLDEIKESCLKALENQEYPFEELVKEVIVDRDMSRNPLFDVMFVLENESDAEQAMEHVELDTGVAVNSGISKFDLTFNITSFQTGYIVSIEYCTDLFKEETIENIFTHFEQLLHLLVNTNEELGKLKLTTEAEEKQILEVFNESRPTDCFDKTIAELFEEQVAMHPEQTAVIFKDKKLTYTQLNARANVVAADLRTLGVTPDDYVGIFAEKSLEMLVGILGIVKAGGAYVPVDPDYPKERIDYILKDCVPKALLMGKNKMETVLPTINLKDSRYQKETAENLEKVNQVKDLIYCIYTSGTTGKPKGSMIEEKSVIRLVKNPDYMELNEETRILQTGSIAFDAATLEIWGALLNGGTLILATQDVITDSTQIASYVEQYKVNTMWLTSSLYNQMVLTDPSVFDKLTFLLIGGEKLSEYHVGLLKKRKTNIRLINGYGPTENTTFTTTYEIPDDFKMLPIGKPIRGTNVYIMDGDRLCGIGIPGELCTGGVGVARGYLNCEELTGEKFIKNPYGNGTLYRTGDLARWLPDGNIEYLGRIDQQVKIRGFRIELAEIKNALCDMEGINEAAVIVKENRFGEKAIHAYFTANKDMDLEVIKDQLKQTMPEYMVPAHMMQIACIPITSNGKVNVRELPEIEITSQKEYVAPETEIETVLAESFEEVLDVSRVGVHANFFELGGDSIKAIRIIMKLRERGYEVAIKDVLSGKTVKQISRFVKESDQDVIDSEELIKQNMNYAYVEVGKKELESNPLFRLIKNYDDNIQHTSIAYSNLMSLRNRKFLEKREYDIYFNFDVMEGYSQDEVKKALKKIIYEQSVLRTYYLWEKKEFVTVQYTDEWRIPLVTLTGKTNDEDKYSISLDSEKEFETYTMQLYSEKELYNENQLLVKIMILQKESGQCKVYVWAHHSLWDNMSSMIFMERMKYYLANRAQMPSMEYNYFDTISKTDQEELLRYGSTEEAKAFEVACKQFEKMVKMDNHCAAVYSDRLEGENLKKFRENKIAWCIKHSRNGWMYNAPYTSKDIYQVPLILNHNARDDDSLNVLGLYLDLYSVIVDLNNSNQLYKELDLMKNSPIRKNGFFYDYLLMKYPEEQIPAVNMNLVEMFGDTRSVRIEKPILALNTGETTGIVMNATYCGDVITFEMSFNPDKQQEMIQMIGADYTVRN